MIDKNTCNVSIFKHKDNSKIPNSQYFLITHRDELKTVFFSVQPQLSSLLLTSSMQYPNLSHTIPTFGENITSYEQTYLYQSESLNYPN